MKRAFATLVTAMFLCLGPSLWADILRYPPARVADPTIGAPQLAIFEGSISEENVSVEELLHSPERQIMPSWNSILSGGTHTYGPAADTPATPPWVVFLLVLSLLAVAKAVQAYALPQRLTMAYARLYWHVFDPLQF
jgi:hypothetical protein